MKGEADEEGAVIPAFREAMVRRNYYAPMMKCAAHFSLYNGFPMPYFISLFCWG